MHRSSGRKLGRLEMGTLECSTARQCLFAAVLRAKEDSAGVIQRVGDWQVHRVGKADSAVSPMAARRVGGNPAFWLAE